MKKKDINKSLNEMKKFIISEMKRESANWDKYEGYDEEKVFKSEYSKTIITFYSIYRYILNFRRAIILIIPRTLIFDRL